VNERRVKDNYMRNRYRPLLRAVNVDMTHGDHVTGRRWLHKHTKQASSRFLYSLLLGGGLPFC
jgi:hypothetical protein